MARQKAFEPEQALSKARTLFWSQGYDGTSMSDLVNELGLSRSSIYDTFGDKRQLYLTALDSYCELAIATITRFLKTGPTVRDGIEQFMMMPVKKLLEKGDVQCGCFMVNSAVEMADDPEVERRFRQLGHNQKIILIEAIAGAQARGEISERYTAAALADHVMNAMRGLNVIPAGSAEKHVLESVIQTTLAIFD